VDAADARPAVDLLVTIGGDRPRGPTGFEELVSTGRSDREITRREAGDLAIVGYTSGTTGLPQGAMISQRALCDCVRLAPSMFRISSYGRCAFTGTPAVIAAPPGVFTPPVFAPFVRPLRARSSGR
jgi:acyl-coenzyme A synthetase/AMP-(fatty) acid ligase